MKLELLRPVFHYQVEQTKYAGSFALGICCLIHESTN